MLADVSISTVTASFSTRKGAQGPASAITRAVKAAHFSARHTCDAPGILRIKTHRTGSNPVSTRKMGWSNVTPSPANQIWILETRFLLLFRFPIEFRRLSIAGGFADFRRPLPLAR
jgi:hypothetical protein